MPLSPQIGSSGGGLYPATTQSQPLVPVAANRIATAPGAVGEAVVLVADDPSKAAANTQALQALLDASGEVRVDVPGTIWITGSLAIGDNTTFVTGGATTLKQADGSQSAILVTKQYQASWTAVTVAWTSGKTAAVTWPAHGLTAGSAIVLQGATLPDWWDVVRVSEVVDANNFRIRLNFLPTAAPVGSLTAKRCNRNIRLDISFDWNYAGNSATPQTPNRMGAVLAFIADSYCSVRGFDVYKYVALVAGALDIQGDVWGLPFSRSDTLKVYGPSHNVDMKVFGQAAEDCMSVQAQEPAAFIAYMPCQGVLSNIKFRDIGGYNTPAGSGAAVVYSDQTYPINGICFEDGELHSMSGTTPALRITSGFGFTPASALIRDVTLKRMMLNAAGAACVEVLTRLRSLRFSECQFISPETDSLRCLRIAAGAFCDEIVFENCTFDMRLWPVAVQGYILEQSGTVNTIVFRNCSFRGSTLLRVAVCAASSVTQSVLFDNCEGDTIDQLLRIEQTATTPPQTTIRGGRYRNVLTGVNARRTARINLDGAVFDGMTNGAARCELSGTVVDLFERACQFINGSLAFACISSGTVNLFSPTLAADVGATGVNRVNGGSCFNTGAARGTLVQNRLVTCAGSVWTQVDTPANIF